MSREIAPKETEYDGVRFRSRIEARWAVFFSKLNLSYVYEPERIRLNSGETYLPDFFLPDIDAYFEVKPNSEEIVIEECNKARLLAFQQPAKHVLLAIGAPNAEVANILPLNQWPAEVRIERILVVPENRYRFMEDRRDEEIYWLHSEVITGSFKHSFMVGGKGSFTNHERLPLVKGRVQEGYEAAKKAFGGM